MASFILSAGYTLADSIDLHDLTNFFVEEKGYVVGALDKDGHRPLTVKVFIQGATTDELNQKQANLSWKIEQAELAYGPNGMGPPVLFWAKLGANESWTYWTVIGGKIDFKDVAVSDERQMEADLTLTCLAEATSDPQALPISPATDSMHPIFLPYVKGDCSALGKLIVRDTGTVPINRLWVARLGHRNLTRLAFTPFYPATGSVALTTDWQTVASFQSPQGDFDSGLFDVVASLVDGSRPLLPITDLDGSLQPTGFLQGGLYEYQVTTTDAQANESAPSNTFAITVGQGSILIEDANPDPASQKWAGPQFLGGSCLNPGAFSIDQSGVCRSTPDGLFISCQSDGWILSNLVSSPLLCPGDPSYGNVAATNKLPPKPGELGYAYTGLSSAFPAPLTGQLVFQYDLNVASLGLGGLGSPIFFPQIAPFGLMHSPFGWAFYCSSASSSQDIEALVSDWKSDKLIYSLFSAGAFSQTVNRITISCDWRNGPLTATLAVNGQIVATLDAERTGAPTQDVFLGMVVTNSLAEFSVVKVPNTDLATWSYTKVAADNHSESSSSSSSDTSDSSDSSNDSSSSSQGDSNSTSSNHGSNNSNSFSSSGTNGGSDNNSVTTGINHTDSSSSSTGVTSSVNSSGNTSGNGTSTSDSDSSSTSVSSSGNRSSSSSGSTSNGSQSGQSTSDSTQSSTGTNTSTSSSSGSSTSTSASTSTTDVLIQGGDVDVPKESVTRQVTQFGQYITTTTSDSTSNSTNSSSNSSSSSSSSLNESNSTSTSDSNSKSTTSSGSGSGSNSSSSSLDNSTSASPSHTDGQTSSVGVDDQGATTTSSGKTTSDGMSTSKTASTSDSTSSSASGSGSSDASTSASTNDSTSTSNSSNISSSSSSSSSSGASSSSSKSKSVITQNVYQIKPLIDTIEPLHNGSLAFASVLLSNIVISDGPIGTGAAVLLTWTTETNGVNQRLYRIRNTASGSPDTQWEYKVLGASDALFLDSDPNGWLPGSPPSSFLGPKAASFRVGYSATPTDPLKFTPPVRPALSNSKSEYLKLATQNLPPGPRQEPESAPGPFYVVIQAKTDPITVVQNPKASVSGVWLLSGNQLDARFKATNTQALEIQLDQRRDKRASGRAYSLDESALVSTLNVEGDLTLSPGGNWFIILAEGPNGIADPDVRFTAQFVYTPRTKFAYGVG